jgi:cellulose biosynthesis protein BcsQ
MPSAPPLSNLQMLTWRTPTVTAVPTATTLAYRWTFIDGPPRVYDVARSAIRAADMVIIPVQPSPYDVWSAKEIAGPNHRSIDDEA